MKPILFLTFLLFVKFDVSAQAPKIQWEKAFGGTAEDKPRAICQTADHGFIVAGYTWSNDKDVSGNHGYTDAWIIKLDSIGSLQWKRTYGGIDADGAINIRITSDGGYIFTGFSYSNDGNVSGHHGSSFYPDAWVVKLDSEGNIEWENSYGGSYAEIAYDILQTYDGGYVFAAASYSSDDDVTGQHGSFDYWIVKLNATGSIEWQKAYGGSGDDEPCSILQTADSGYVVAGYSTSNNGDVTKHHGYTSNRDIWMIKLDKNGALTGERSLPGRQYETPYSMCFSSDSGYVIAGEVESYPKHGIIQHGNGDFGVIKVSKRGIIDTVCAIGGSQSDDAASIILTDDKGYIVIGQTLSNDGDVTGFHGTFDYWVVKLDSNLRLQWEECLGGEGVDVPYSIKQTFDNGYIIAGESDSYDEDVTGNHGGGDYWIVKLAPDKTSVTSASVSQVRTIVNSNPKTFNLSLLSNPSANQLRATYSSLQQGTIELEDLTGRVVTQQILQSGTGNISIDISTVPQGIYLLRFTTTDNEVEKEVEIIH